MTHHIDVSAILRRTVCELYSNLVTRQTGATVRTEIEQALAESPGRALTIIDFSHVGLLDFSCADEIVAKLLLRQLADPAAPEGYFVFRGIGDAHLDAIEAVLERHGLALVTQDAAGHATIVGRLEDGERRAWETVAGRGPAAPVDLAAATGCTPDDAARLLESLARRRLLVRVPDPDAAADDAAASLYVAVGWAA